MTPPELHVGDSLAVMATLGAETFAAIVTDPPYGLGFMGKAWDHGVPGEPYWREALRVAKPGAHLVAFGGTRTFHRLTCAIEDAGWEIRDCLMWLYGSGYPKSHDVGAAIDKAAGADREVIGHAQGNGGLSGRNYGRSAGAPRGEWAVTAPATEDAQRWDGWGTALKPGWEPIILARKPLRGTVAGNVLAHGVGGLNVNGCRLDPRGVDQVNGAAETGNAYGEIHRAGGKVYGAELGRWPANVILDEDAAARLDAEAGNRPSGRLPAGTVRRAPGGAAFYGPAVVTQDFGGDDGGPSRFYYCAKASTAERNAGLEGFAKRSGGALNMRNDAHAHATGNAGAPAANKHPTVKPVELMRWLVRLVTPPGGRVLDPFCGSGSTGVAVAIEGGTFVGIDLDPVHADVARARILHAAEHPAALPLFTAARVDDPETPV